tara:strand:- start:112 stop:426 length:315 start_codon:yes stop_codon:yes gene_type:complete
MSLNGKQSEPYTQNWVMYLLLGTITFLIINSIHTALLTLLVSGAFMLFIWSYLSKPIAEIQPPKEETLFEKNKIDRNTWNNPSEPNAQRKRYLKSLNDSQKRAA